MDNEAARHAVSDATVRAELSLRLLEDVGQFCMSLPRHNAVPMRARGDNDVETHTNYTMQHETLVISPPAEGFQISC